MTTTRGFNFNDRIPLTYKGRLVWVDVTAYLQLKEVGLIFDDEAEVPKPVRQYPSQKTGRFETEDPSSTERVLADIGEERERQFAKWGMQHHPDGTDERYAMHRDAMQANCEKAAAEGRVEWYHIMHEEWAEALAEVDPITLRAELVQVAAVAAAWIEDIDSRQVLQFDQVFDLGGEG